MASWGEFVAADPELGEIATARIDGVGLVLVGTLRANGWPRLSPVEPLVADGRLYLGMMWQSRKALDLRRDRRCTVHSTVTDPAGTEGDVKVYGRALDVTDPVEREHYGQALEARTGWRPDSDEFHLFVLDIVEVGYFAVVGDGHETTSWRPAEAPPDPGLSAPAGRGRLFGR